MEDRPYDSLVEFPLAQSVPPKYRHLLEGKHAVALAHRKELKRIAEKLAHRQSVLVTCDKAMTSYALDCLGERLQSHNVQWCNFSVPLPQETPKTTASPASGSPSSDPPRLPGATSASAGGNSMFSPSNRADSAQGGRGIGVPVGSVPTALIQQLPGRIAEALNHEPSILVCRHLDLMTVNGTGQPREQLNDVLFWLNEYPNVVVLAFWDPGSVMPKTLEEIFPHRESLEVFDREVLWKLVSEGQARKLCADEEVFTLSAQLNLYRFLSGTNVVEVRRILRDMMEDARPSHPDPGQLEAALESIRERASGSAASVSVSKGRIAGYETLKNELDRRVIFPAKLRYRVKRERDLKRADALFPRGVLLTGPPGTGKTEICKWLAGELGAAIFIISGPELKQSRVGATEAAIRRVFAVARRAAPSLIIMDEIDALTPARDANQSNFEASMVAQFLTEMDGLRRDEAVLVVGTTNLIEAVDSAFRRPGRFGLEIHVGYPDASDRRAILKHYSDRLGLVLSGDSLTRLTEMTEGPLDPDEARHRQTYIDAFVKHRVGKEYYEQAGPLLQRQLSDMFRPREVPRFSGDHLSSICHQLLQNAIYQWRKNENDSFPSDEAIREMVNVPAAQERVVEAMRRRLGTEETVDLEDFGGDAELGLSGSRAL